MAVLTPQQRNTLETAVKQARTAAEQGAFNALHSLGVDNPEPFQHLTTEERTLRNHLRSKGRLLGDELPSTGAQSLDHLSYELAYETWHKMLFAKFLEANDLLMHTEGVAVTLEDCEELAKEENFVDKWDAAANYASNMLPAIFRTDDPLIQVYFAINDRIKLEGIIDALETSIFLAEDALGWVYQFWQSEAKAKINAGNEKINGEKLPAVTQLFTEPYMVHFLIDNTLGAWWVSRNPGVTPPVKFEYLRFLDNGTPAAGQFEEWPDKTSEVTSLDPCMGSGHFVVSLFTVLATLRMYEEGLTKEEATDLVISENLHGLELDARCTQIAAFNLAFTAWKFCGYYRELPEMNLACSGIAPKGKVEDWIKLVENANDERLVNGMRMLYDHFQLAPELGSLLDPSTIKADAFTAGFNELQPYLSKALANEVDKDQIERGVMAAGIAKAGEILALKYTLIITNVPYLARAKQDKILQDYCAKNFLDAKSDLANVFLEKMLKSNIIGGISSTVMPQNWLFLTTYQKHRERLLSNETWNLLARLGAGAFSQISGEVVKAILISIQHKKPIFEQLISGIDVSSALNTSTKAEGLKIVELKNVNQLAQLKNPDSRVVLEIENNISILEKYSKGIAGIQTGDFPQFGRGFWELVKTVDWEFETTTQSQTTHFGGKYFVIYWQNFEGILSERQKKGESYVRGWSAFGNKGILVSQTGSLSVSLYNGEYFDNNCAVILPSKLEILPAVWCFCSSIEFHDEVRKIDQSLKVTNGTLTKVPFDLTHWQKVAEEKYPNGLPNPYSNDATQWLFHGHPKKADNPLHVSVARLLGYRWPAENDKNMELADEARELISAVKAFDYMSDDDGIFCIPSVNGEEAGAERVRGFLQAVYDEEWNNSSLSSLFTKEGATSSNLEDWLRKEFFSQHCKLFQNRPFIWHIWDGRSDGFSALVNYHKLDKDNLSKLIYAYLGDWIRMCEAKKNNQESGAEGLLSAALKLKEKLELILEGEAPYDIFVRWKPLNQQPIGWEPDLNDGVRLNIRPFVEAGVLRNKFNIKWGKDRGKNPVGSYWGEERNNDIHLTLEEKRNARKN